MPSAPSSPESWPNSARKPSNMLRMPSERRWSMLLPALIWRAGSKGTASERRWSVMLPPALIWRTGSNGTASER
eukprot:3392361-Pyramimonas_sp.AAC.1